MSQYPSDHGDIPTLVNSSTEIVWPDDLPDAPEFQETNEAHDSPNIKKPETRDWTEVLEEQDQQLSVLKIQFRQNHLGHHFSHLPNSVVDWERDGRFICRVQGLSCYGQNFVNNPRLKEHLASKPHRDHDASLAVVPITPGPTPAIKRNGDVQVSQPTPKKPRLKHTIENTTGSDITMQFEFNDEELNMPEIPRALLYPICLVIPDSDEDSENEILWNEAPRLKHTIENTTGMDITMEFEFTDEALKMPVIPRAILYPPCLVIADSEEDSGDEVLA